MAHADKRRSEKTITELFKQDSLQAFSILYDKYSAALLSAIERITGEQAVAEKILQ